MKKIAYILFAVLLIGAGAFFWYYRVMYAPNAQEETANLYIPTRASYKQVLDSLEQNNILKDIHTFKRAARLLGYDDKNVKSGRYIITTGMSNEQIVQLLKEGKQSPIRLTFNNIRTKDAFASFLSKHLEADSAQFIQLLNDTLFTASYSFTPETVYTVFLPNTYAVYWNTSPEKFFNLMSRYHQRFWNEERRLKAQELNLTPAQVGILASIVYSETKKVDEMPLVAGVYLNRLKKKIRLQADPTVIFAEGNFGIRRVKKSMLTNPSPYNTYVHTGLPPGPICMPSLAAIDAVLNYAPHNYIFFCAKDDFSGYHSFAVTVQEHSVNARKFQKALSKRGVR